MNHKTTEARSAFTLVELIVVITILAILATVGFLALQGYTKDAKDSATKTNVRTVAQAVELESAGGGQSVRKFASFSGAYAMSGKVLGAVLSGGTVSTAGTNYTPGPVDFAALKLDADKFESDGSSYLMSAVDVPEKLVTGKTRTRTLFQIAALVGTSAYVEGTFSSALAASGSGTATETTVTGIIANPDSPGGTVALASNLDAPVAGGGSNGGGPTVTCNPGETVSGGTCHDPRWADVWLLLHLDGNAAYSGSSVAWVNNEGMAYTTATGWKFGGSLNGPDSFGHAFRLLYDPAIVFGASDFTVELWFRTNSLGGKSCVFGAWNLGSPPHDLCFDNATGSATLEGTFNGSVKTIATTGKNWKDDQWHFAVIQRSGTTFELFIDGVSKGSAAVTGSNSDPGNQRWIGRTSNDTSYDWRSYVDEVRITKWVARYPTGQSFTIPQQAFAGQ